MDDKEKSQVLNELYGLEAMGQMFLENVRKIRLKLAGDSSPAKKKRDGLSEEEKARIRATRRKNILRMSNKS